MHETDSKVLESGDATSYLAKTSPSFLRHQRTKKLLIPAFAAISNLSTFARLLVMRFYDGLGSISEYGLLREISTLLEDLMGIFRRSTVNFTEIQSYLQIIGDIQIRVHDVLPELEGRFVEATLQLGQLGKLQSGKGLRLMWPTWRAASATSQDCKVS